MVDFRNRLLAQKLLAIGVVCCAMLSDGSAAAQQGAAGAPGPDLVEGYVAVVNDRVITSYDLRQRALLFIATQNLPRNEETFRQVAGAARDSLINEHLQLQEAEKWEVAITDEDVDRQLGRLAAQNGATIPEMLAQFRGLGVNEETLRQQIRADISWSNVIQGVFGRRIRVSPTQVDEALERIAHERQQEQVLVAEIFVPVPNPIERPQARQFTERLIQEMQKGAQFPELARRFSGAPSAATGGDVGWVTMASLRPEVAAVASTLQDRELSQPIETPDGFYIIAIRDRRAAGSAEMMVEMRQIVTRIDDVTPQEAARRRKMLEEAREASIGGCSRIKRAIADPALKIVDIGEAALSKLTAEFRAEIEKLGSGQATAIRNDGRMLSTTFVCQRMVKAGTQILSRDQIEQDIVEQQLALFGDRHLRDLRQTAAIIYR